MEIFVHELADVDASRVIDWLPLFLFLLDPLVVAIILILTLIVKGSERVCISFIIVLKIFFLI